MRRLLVAGGLVVLAAVNVAAAGSNRFWDPAPAGQSLDHQTRQVLAQVHDPLRITMFAKEDTGPQHRLLERY
ncbi:MAG TPA: hypothetical protein VHL53_19870, partial [Acidimicrobiia bacterium]|nr:hypothetical protein [Acidimicrobiia bacterium]